jgi:hypothetical protein
VNGRRATARGSSALSNAASCMRTRRRLRKSSVRVAACVCVSPCCCCRPHVHVRGRRLTPSACICGYSSRNSSTKGDMSCGLPSSAPSAGEAQRLHPPRTIRRLLACPRRRRLLAQAATLLLLFGVAGRQGVAGYAAVGKVERLCHSFKHKNRKPCSCRLHPQFARACACRAR